MKAPETWKALLRMGRTIAFIDAAIFLLVGLLCLAAGWLSWIQYGDVLSKVGLLLMLVTVLIGVGGNFGRVEDMTAFAITGAMKADTFLTQMQREGDNRARFMLSATLAALVVLVIGYWLMVQ